MKKSKKLSTILIAGALIFSSGVSALAGPRCEYGPAKWKFDSVVSSEACNDETHKCSCKIETLRWIYFSECKDCGDISEITEKIIVNHTGEK